MSQDMQLKTYQKRLRDDVKSLADNFEQLIRLMKVENDASLMTSAKIQESGYEMKIRAGNMSRAAESVMKLIWDIKQYLIINDFPLINETISNEAKNALEEERTIDAKLTALRDDISNELYDLEDEYYNSPVR